MSASAIVLWYTLMHMNNKAMWIEEFTAAGPVLRFKSGLTESSFKRARAELKEKGYITYTSRGRNQAPAYRMIRLDLAGAGCGAGTMTADGRDGSCLKAEQVDMRADQITDGGTDQVTVGKTDQTMDVGLDRGVDVEANQNVDREMDRITDHFTNQNVNRDMNQNADHLADHLADHQANRTASTLIKHKQNINKTKQDETTAAEDAFVFYQENFGVISPFVSDSLLNWVNDSGEPLVMEAMKRAVERNKLSWRYVKSILQAWDRKGISSVEDAKAEEVAFQNERKQQSRRNGLQQNVEVVPDWFWKRQQEDALKAEKKEQQLLEDDPETEAEIMALLEKHRNIGCQVSAQL
ncbi:DnaD domain-containing protein [Lentibacillus sp. Marseille-P4043]|uniref:DnaD domain-containing protein n=1 Tax=Lentibacillus sp. Marseille-P4043 TaxID=2040293 RepID=UPI00131A5B85|nr:DnaD domain protein [Lentibacillus sp. Marseille-P4043]